MTLIIAEAGVNHNGDENLALKLVEAAYRAGADVVKFQTFKANKIVTEEAKQAEYQVINCQKQESQLAMLERLELPYEAHHRLVKRCEELGIEFLSTAFDLDSLNFLVNDLRLKRLKVPSGEITNAPLLLEHARTQCDLIVSTGMATLSEIELALGVIAFGYISEGDSLPSVQAFQDAYASEKGQRVLKEKVTVLHCTTEYPAPVEEINLRAMDTLGLAFGLPSGYSDHSEGIIIPVAAVARGATIIEKHFTLDKTMEGPDHSASLDPEELSNMVKAVRDIEIALGSGVKLPTRKEALNKTAVRKSIVAADVIKKGDVFSSDNLDIKRPGDGISPYLYWDYIGTVSPRSYDAGQRIDNSKASSV